MKRLFFGLAIAVLAFGASAFTNVTDKLGLDDGAYITGVDGSGNYIYSQDKGDQECGEGTLPCRVEPNGPNPFDFTVGTVITPAELASRATIISSQVAY